jgi:DMSO/TMAO reductase YedYZ molybdopterin-dependent catalytic subunit
MFFQGFQPVPATLGFAGRLRVSGLESGRERELSFEQLRAFPKEHQVANVGEFVKNRRGSAVRVRALFDDLEPSRKARHVVLRSADARETPVTFPLRAVGEHGLLVYAWDGKPLSYWHGGPFHLVLPGFEYAASDMPHLVALEFAEAPSIAEPRARTADSRVPLVKGSPDYSVVFSMPGFAPRSAYA